MLTPEEERTLLADMRAYLSGTQVPPDAAEQSKDIYAWRLLRWEADMPLTEDERCALLTQAEEAMQPAGLAAGAFSEDGDTLTMLLCLTRFPAKVHRDTMLWLCIHAMTEECSLSQEQEGTMFVGEEFANITDWQSHLEPMAEVSDWWVKASPITAATARTHRTHLQTIVKRRQYTALGGYVSRALRTETETNRVCFGFVPLAIEAIWSQHSEISLQKLTEELNLNEMARKPQDALLKWLTSLQPRLRACPETCNTAPIDRVIAGIEADCSLPYSQANLSRSLGLTPAYFCRLFHEKTGQHFSTFLTRTRMEKAQKLLAENADRSLQEISQACGYPNKSYFCQVFKKYTGLTPGEYEQQMRASTP